MTVTSISCSEVYGGRYQKTGAQYPRVLKQEAPGQEEIAEELLKRAYKILAKQVIELEELEELRANKILIKELCRA